MVNSYLPIVDLHEDIATYFLYHGGGEPLGDLRNDVLHRDADIPKYIRAGVKLVFASIFSGVETFRPEESRRLEELYGVWVPAIVFRASQSMVFESLAIYYKLVEAYPEFKIVESIDDIKEVFKSVGRIGLLLHMEGAEAVKDPIDLVLYKKLGLRSIGLTWNYNNRYAASCTSKKDYGLTPEGEELVRTANKHGIIVDLAHSSKNTSLDILNITSKPVIISHANIRRFVDTPRNVDDEVLEALYKNRGVIGLSVIGPLISSKKKPSMDDLVQHFLYIYETYGANIIAIGTDFHGLLGLPAPEGLESIDKLPILLNKLKEKGLNENDIKKIAYENALRVIEENIV